MYFFFVLVHSLSRNKLHHHTNRGWNLIETWPISLRNSLTNLSNLLRMTSKSWPFFRENENIVQCVPKIWGFLLGFWIQLHILIFSSFIISVPSLIESIKQNSMDLNMLIRSLCLQLMWCESFERMKKKRKLLPPSSIIAHSKTICFCFSCAILAMAIEKLFWNFTVYKAWNTRNNLHF